ncbi:ChbG/HpnK family deacetylase [Bradyrhizobium sp.]|uniref:ChbG/HpnK family deacetylase n=1 Tax=Bradyrhizobium sp. TaxID=376 RepID=UPI002D5E3AA0|nr:ChbG/HpnK family deacetylase [Bradyrhizobium sp.]HZR75491.1 ChbG/HpnK family deacetylase [Bradyrhizobium sp.]
MSRRIWLCADDYGISPGVNRAIRDLIENGRLNATSVMTVGPAIGRDDVNALQAAAKANPHCAIGLHVTLTGRFRPLTLHFRPVDGGLFLPHAKLFRRGLTGRLDLELMRTEVLEQLSAFADLFGRSPDFVDGHQHVQLFPGVRAAFLAAVKEAAPKAWIRQCGRSQPWSQRLGSPKALVLDVLSAQFRTRAARTELAFNSAFAGAYDFSKEQEFGALMQQFLQGMPDGGVVMCHPGVVDEVLISLDPFTVQREREYEFLRSEGFAPLLAANNVTLG